jgi:hypothetical protein
MASVIRNGGNENKVPIKDFCEKHWANGEKWPTKGFSDKEWG